MFKIVKGKRTGLSIVVVLLALLVIGLVLSWPFLGKYSRTPTVTIGKKVTKAPVIKVKGSKLRAVSWYSLDFSKDLKQPVKFRVGSKAAISFKPVILSPKGDVAISKNKVTYKNVYKNTDLERLTTSQGLKQNYILKAPGHPTTFKEALSTFLTIKEESDGSLGYYDGSKKVAFSPKPYLVDAKGKKIDLRYEIGVGSRRDLTPKEKRPVRELGADLTPLPSHLLLLRLPSLKGLTYPIKVDPSIFTLPNNPPVGVPEALSATSIKWNFTDNLDDEDGFKLHDASHNEIATAGPNTDSITETGLLPNTIYTRHIHAYKGAVDSDPSADITKTTLSESSTLATATDGTLTDQIEVSWQPSLSADHYHVYKDGVAGTGTLVYDASGTSFVDNVTDNVRHTYYIYSANAENVDSATFVSDIGYVKKPVTWTTKGDFENNAVVGPDFALRTADDGTAGIATVRNQVDTSSSVGDVKLSKKEPQYFNNPGSLGPPGTLTYNPGNGMIYSFSYGGIWEYDLKTNIWSGKAYTPVDIGNGAASTVVNGEIYAFRGGGTNGYWRYNLATDSWQDLTSFGPSFPYGVDYGGALTSRGNDVYGFAGGGFSSFKRYIGGYWEFRAYTPSPVGVGGALTYNPASGTIYGFGGTYTTSFWEYSPGGNSWTVKAAAPAPVGHGAALTYNPANGKIYAFRGNLSDDFWEYNPSTDSWSVKASAFPSRIWGWPAIGGSLTYHPATGRVYALGFGGSLDFQEYDPVTNSWSQVWTGGDAPPYKTRGTISGIKVNVREERQANWSDISWTGDTPANTSLRFRTRGADTETGLAIAPWSDYYSTSSSSITTNPSRWLEVEAILESTDGVNSPRLDDLSVSYYRTFQVPAAPTATQPTTLSSNSIKWNFIDNSDNEESFELHDASHNVLATVPANSSSIVETGLLPNTAYTKHIHANNFYGESSASADVTKTTLAEPPTSATVTDGTLSGQVQVSWLPSASASHYHVYKDGPAGVVTLVYNSTGTSFADAVSDDITHTYYIYSANSEDADSAGFISPLAAPTIGTAQALSESSIKWNFTDNSSNEIGFELHDSAHNTIATAATNASSITETGLLPNTAYIRHVHAYNVGGDSTPSADVSKTTLSYPPTFPIATDGTLVDQIEVSWQPSLSADHYHVYRDGVAGVGMLVYDANSASFIDNVTDDVKHTYYLYSANAKNVDSATFVSDIGYAKKFVTWTTKGDFENNASTTGIATDRSNVALTGANPTDDSSVSLTDPQATGIISDLKIDVGKNKRANWSTVSWNSAALPANTAIKFRVRTSNDNTNWSGWSNYFIQSAVNSISGLADLAAGGLTASRWLQLETVLESTDGLSSPRLDDFSLSYNSYNIPKAPTVSQPTALSSSSIKWNFTDNSNDEDGFKLHDASHNEIATAGPNTDSITETGLLPNTIYTRHIHAYKGAVDSDPSADITKTTLSESSTLATATDGTLTDQIEVSWQPSLSADHYHVYKDGPAGVGTLVYNSTGTSFTDNVIDNDVHVYSVYTANSEDENSASYIYDSGYQLFINQALAPTMGIPEALSEASIKWNFTDNSSNEKGFVLHDTAHNTTATVKANSSEITENGLVSNTSYSRHIHAFNAGGDSLASAEATRYTLPVAHNILPDKQVGQWYNDSVNFFVNAAGFGPGGVAYYRYAWNQDAIYNFSNLETQWMSGILTTTPLASGAWYLHVKPFNGENIPNGVTNFGPFYFDLETPSAPSQLTLTLALTASSPNQIDLSWNDAADSGGSGLAGYKIERAVNVGGVPGTFSQIATSTATSYKDEGLAYNTKYWYRVAAYDNANNVGNYSESVSKATLPKPPTWTTRGDFENNAVTTGTPTNPTANIFISGRNASEDAYVTFGDIWSPSGSNILVGNEVNETFNPAIANNSTTNQYLVAWSGMYDGANIYARLVNSDSSLGAKFTVSTGRKPSIAYNPTTNQYLIVWEERVPDPFNSGYRGIYAQLINADGSLIGSKFAVHVPNVAAFEPAVAYNSIDNQFMVATSNQSSSLPRVYVQRINADGSLAGVTLNISSGSSPIRPEIAYNSVDNQFLVTWVSSGGVEAQRINSDGTLAGSKFVVTTLNGSSTQKQALAYNSLNNQFMVAWHDNPAGNYDIYAQKVNADGTLADSQFSLTSAADDEALADVVHVLNTNQFMFIWKNILTSQIYAQATNANGVLTGQSFSLSPASFPDSLSSDPAKIAYNPTLNQFMATFNKVNAYEVYIQKLERFTDGTSNTGLVSGFKINAGSAMGGWSNIYWNANTPANTSVKFRTRGADTEAGLATANWDGPGGAGSNTYYSSSGSSITTPASQWLEVELTLESSDGLNYPALSDFSISSYNDQTAPVSQITSPANNTILQGLNASISGTSTDFGGSAVDKVEVSVDGGATWNIASPVGGSWNSWTYNWLLPADGIYNIKTRATDTNGNQEVAGAGIIVTVDNTPPQVFNLIEPADGSRTDTPPTFSWQAATDSSGIAKYQLYINGVLNKDNITSTSTTANGNFINQNYTWFVRAIDNAGNIRDSVIYNFSYFTANSTATWTTKGDFENNASTTQTQTTRTALSVSGAASTDDADIRLSYGLKTTYAGLSNTNGNGLAGMYFTSATTGYAVGGNEISKTVDSGSTWDYVFQGGSSEILNSVYFTDTNTGYAVGSFWEGTQLKGLILKTTDAGATWSRQDVTADDIVLNDIHFPNAGTGYAIGGSVSGASDTILKTADGGLSWSRINLGTSDWLEKVQFLNVDTGYIFSQQLQRPIYKTTDGGINWQRLDTGLEIFDFYFTDAVTGYAVGSAGKIFKTTNEAATWDLLNLGITRNASGYSLSNVTLSDIYFTDANTGYAVGDNGTLLKTTDAGATWSTASVVGFFDLARVHFPTENVGYAGTWSGDVVKITSGYESSGYLGGSARGLRVQTANGEKVHWKKVRWTTSLEDDVTPIDLTNYTVQLRVKPTNNSDWSGSWYSVNNGVSGTTALNTWYKIDSQGLLAGDIEIDPDLSASEKLEIGIKLTSSDAARTPVLKDLSLDYETLPPPSTNNLKLFKTDGLTEVTNGVTNERSVKLRLTNLTMADYGLSDSASINADFQYKVGAGGTWTDAPAATYDGNTQISETTLGNLQQETTYYFRARVRDTSTSSQARTSKWIEFGSSLEVQPQNVPATPTTGIAEALSIDSIKWKFTDNSNDEDGFKLQDSSHNDIATVPADSSFITETGLLPNTTYTRHIHAYNTSGNSLASVSVSKTTLAEPPLLPITATDGTLANQIQVSWTASPSADHYHVYKDGLANTGALVYNSNGTSFTDNVIDDITHTYYVYAVNSEDENSASWISDTGYGVLPLAAPTSGTPEALSETSIKWNFTDNSNDEDGFKLHDASHNEITTVGPNTDSMTETGLLPNTTYIRHIHAYKGAVDSDPSADITKTTLAEPPLLPITATDGTLANQIQVSWTASPSADHYHVYKDGLANTGALVYNSNGTSFTDNVIDDITHTYYVYAVNSEDENSASWISDTGFRMPLPAIPAMSAAEVLSSNSIKWNFTDNSNDEDGFRLHDISHQEKMIIGANSNSFTETGLATNTLYTRHIHAYNTAGDSLASINISQTTLADPPLKTKATDGTFADKIDVSWLPSPSADHYHVYKDGQAGVGTLIYNAGATSFSDQVADDEPHTYYVYSANADDVDSSGFASDTGYTTLSLPASPIKIYGQSDDDTYVQKVTTTSSQYTNYPAADNLRAGLAELVPGELTSWKSFLRFNSFKLGKLPIEITSAKVYLREHPAITGCDQTAFFHSLPMNPGSDSGETLWNTLAHGGNLGLLSCLDNAYDSIDVTSHLKEDIEASQDYTYYQIAPLAITGNLSSNHVSFDYAGTASDPYLEVTYAPVAPTLNSFIADGSGQIRLKFTDNSINEDDFHFYLSTSPNPDTTSSVSLISSSSKTEFGVVYEKLFTGLSPGTRYYVRARAHDHASGSYSSYSNELNRYTFPSSPLAPIVMATGADKLKITINTNDGNPPSNLYAIYNSTLRKYLQIDGSLGNQPVFIPAAGWNSFYGENTNLNSDTPYSYQAQVMDENNRTGSLGEASLPIRTFASPPVGTSAIGQDEGPGNYKVKVSWNSSGSQTKFRVFSSSDNFSSIKYEGSATQYEETGLDPATVYTYRIYAVNGDEVENPAYAEASSQLATLPLVAPSVLFMTADSDTQLSASFLDNSLIEDDFHFYLDRQSPALAEDFGPQTTLSKENIGNSYTQVFNDLAPNTRYFLRLKAHDHASSQFSNYSEEVAVYTKAAVLPSPSVSASGSDQLSIFNGGNPPNTQYAVYNNELAGYIQVDGLIGSNPVYQTISQWGSQGIVNRGLQPNTAYTYKVKAKNGDGVETNFSRSSAPRYTWAQTPFNALVIYTYRFPNSPSWYIDLFWQGGIGDSYQIRGPISVDTNNTTYRYEIDGCCASFGSVYLIYGVNKEGVVNPTPAKVLPEWPPPYPQLVRPRNLSAAAVSSSQINLSWQAPDPNLFPSPIDSYKIYRDGVEIAEAFGTTYSDTGLAADIAYTYYVRAQDGSVLSDPSNQIQAITFASIAEFDSPLLTNVRVTSPTTLSVDFEDYSTFEDDFDFFIDTKTEPIANDGWPVLSNSKSLKTVYNSYIEDFESGNLNSWIASGTTHPTVVYRSNSNKVYLNPDISNTDGTYNARNYDYSSRDYNYTPRSSYPGNSGEEAFDYPTKDAFVYKDFVVPLNSAVFSVSYESLVYSGGSSYGSDYSHNRIALYDQSDGGTLIKQWDSGNLYGGLDYVYYLTYDLSAYAGKTVRVYARSHTSAPSDAVYLLLDDVRITGSGQDVVYSYTKDFRNLEPNTKYYVRSKAHGFENNTYSDFSNELAAYTLANIPEAPSVEYLSSNETRVVVNEAGNSSNTEYAIFNNTAAKYIQSDGSLGDTAAYKTYQGWGGTAGFVNRGLTPNTDYTYKVKAKNANGIETTFSPDSVPVSTLGNLPTKPRILLPTNITSTSITWNWRDNSYNETGFVVHDESEQVVANLGANATTYTETNLQPDTVYKRHIHAVNSDGESLPSDEETARTLLLGPTKLNVEVEPSPSTKANISWQPPTLWSPVSYKIYRYSQRITQDNLDRAQEIGTVSQTNFTDIAAADEVWYYQITAIHEDGRQSDLATDVISDVAHISAPSPHGKYSQGTAACANCHRGHTGIAKALIAKNNEQICFSCHDGTGSKYNIAVTWADEVDPTNKAAHNEKLAPPATSEVKCAKCHDPHGTDKPWALKNAEEALCFICHNSASLPNTMNNWDIQAQFNKTSRHAITGTTADGLAGAKVECSSCHGPHTVQATDGKKLSDPDNTMNLWIGSKTDFCLKCHDNNSPIQSLLSAIFVPYSVLFPKTDNFDFFPGWNKTAYKLGGHNAQGIECTKCHNPHGSNNQRLAAYDYDDSPTESKEENLCLKCHGIADANATLYAVSTLAQWGSVSSAGNVDLTKLEVTSSGQDAFIKFDTSSLVNKYVSRATLTLRITDAGCWNCNEYNEWLTLKFLQITDYGTLDASDINLPTIANGGSIPMKDPRDPGEYVNLDITEIIKEAADNSVSIVALKIEQINRSSVTFGSPNEAYRPKIEVFGNRMFNFNAVLNEPNRHPIKDKSDLHKDTEDSANLGGLNRHAECYDCHNPHENSSTPEKTQELAPNAYGAIKGAMGVSVTNKEPGAPLEFKPKVVEKEYELCFKCHSSNATLPPDVVFKESPGMEFSLCTCHFNWGFFGGAKLPKPDIGKDSIYKINKQDKAMEFNPNNASFHPVEAAGKNLGIKDETFIEGTPWNPTSGNDPNYNPASAKVYCTDCHGQPNTGLPNGPHGSSNRVILKAPFQQFQDFRAPYPYDDTTDSVQADVCFLCHNSSVYLSGRANELSSRYPHEMAATLKGGCGYCHTIHGSTKNKHLMRDDISDYFYEHIEPGEQGMENGGGIINGCNSWKAMVCHLQRSIAKGYIYPQRYEAAYP